MKNGAKLESTLVKPIAFCRYCKTSQHQVCYWTPSKKDINEWLQFLKEDEKVVFFGKYMPFGCVYLTNYSKDCIIKTV